MPAKDSVSILWQIIFTFIPILDLYAFYRINKLRKYFLYVIISLIAIMIIMITVFVSEELRTDFRFEDDFTSQNEMYLSLLGAPIEIGFHILAIYFVYTWSKRWNEQYTDKLI